MNIPAKNMRINGYAARKSIFKAARKIILKIVAQKDYGA
jgi:hypothetical protein